MTFSLSLSGQRDYLFRWFSARTRHSYSGNVNGQWIEKMFAAIDAGDWAGLPAFFHPAMVYERPGYDPFVGRDRVMRFYREERVILRGSHTLDGTVVENAHAAAWGRIDAVHTDGTPIGVGFADIYLLEQGAIRLRRSHFFVPAV